MNREPTPRIAASRRLRSAAIAFLALLAVEPAAGQSANCYPASGASTVIIGTGSGDISSALASAISTASAGQHILIRAGTYTGGSVTLDRDGTSTDPIVIRTESGIGSVTIDDATWTWANTSSYLVLEGLYFNSSHLELNGDHNRITRCRFREIDQIAIRVGNAPSPYIRGGRDCRIDHCDFSDMRSPPVQVVQVRPVQFVSGLSARLLIDHCDFHDLTTDDNPTDVETVTTYGTDGALELPRGETVTLDRCRFSNIHILGQGEVIPVKMGGWVTRFCTFDDIGTYYSHRSTRGSEVRSSWFEAMDTVAIRNWGPDHLFIGNRFVGGLRVDASAGSHTWTEVLANLGVGRYSPATNNTFIGNRLGSGQILVGGYWTNNSPAVAHPASNNLFEANTRDSGGSAESLLGSIHGMSPAHTLTPPVNATTNTYFVPAVKLTAADVGLFAPDPFCSGFPPVAHWTFDETSGTTAADSSGNANTGTVTAGTWTAGQLGNGLSFNGTTSTVNALSEAGLDNLPEITVAAWIKATSMGEGGKGRIVVKGAGTAPTAGWHFLLDGTRALSFVVDYDGTNLARFSASDAIGSSFGVWRHVAVTWTGSATATNVKLYVDGAEVTYATTTNGVGNRVNDGASTFYLGNSSTLDRTFDGVLDDVRVYNYALSASQVLALYQSGGAVVPTGLTATATAYNQINLAWTDVSNELGYKIERKKGAGGSWSQIDTTGAGVTTYNDTTAGTGTTYYYRVRSYNSAGNSGYSNEAGATTVEIADRKGHWKFNETTGTTAADSSGSVNPGTLSAFSGTYWVAGKIDNGLTFDGADDIVNTGSGSSLDNLPAITVSAWIKPSSLGEGGRGRIVVKGAGNAPTAGWHFYLDGTNALSFLVDHATTDVMRTSATNALGASLGEWKHVVATWTGSTTATNIKIYVDNAEVSYATTTNGAGARVDDNASTFYIGNSSAQDRTFNGVLDDIRVYNRVLSAAEITAIHRAGH